jgi:transcriptional regulator with XRE-family HTH domain
MTTNKGDKIKNLRIQNKMTLEEVGERIGVSKQTLYKYENNIITNIPSDKIEGLAKIFNVSPALIMGWDDTPKEYYKDPEAAEFAEYLRTRPGARMLFSAAKDISKEDMEKAVEYIELLKLKNK